MITESVGDRFNKAGAFAVARGSNGFFGSGARRHHVTSVHLLAREPGSNGLLRQRLGAGLQSLWH